MLLLQRVSRGYVVGPELQDALRTCNSLKDRGVSSTICFWDGENDSPEHVLGN